MTVWIRALISIAYTALCLWIFSVASSDFVIALGSDSGDSIYRTPLWARIVALTLAIVSFNFSRFLQSPYFRNAVPLLGVSIFTLSLHGFGASTKTWSIYEFWGPVRTQEIEWPGVEGDAYCLEYAERFGIFSMLNKDSEVLRILDGVYPWNLNMRNNMERYIYPNCVPPNNGVL